MIDLNRSKENKWILQKNISDLELFIEYLKALNSQENEIDNEQMRISLQGSSYTGRSSEGSSNTMGVRLSQTCFYMFGYKNSEKNKFFPSPMTNLLLSDESELSEQQIGLINLFSMQYPHPYSETNSNFNLYFGRLLIKLLLDEKLEKKLYIDECIFFLVFLEKIDSEIYENLINSILLFRTLPFKEKELMFKSIENYNEVFSNAVHEMKYYFIKIFVEFGVFDFICDRFHNDGNLLKFYHGTSTIRNDACKPRGSYSGYITINSDIINDAKKLNNEFDAFETPCTTADDYIVSEDDWTREIYQFKPLEYIETLMINDNERKEIIKIIKNMVYQSKHGTNDGKSFEKSLKPFFYLFEEANQVEIISGPGNPDLICAMADEHENSYKISIDAKKTHGITSSIHPVRINNHRKKYGAEYSIVVSPRFARGVKGDIMHYPIVTIEAETLAEYCLNECLSSLDNNADFNLLNELIKNNLGTDITIKVNQLIEDKFEMREE